MTALDLGYKAGIFEVNAVSPKVLWLLGANAGALTREAQGTFLASKSANIHFTRDFHGIIGH